MQKMWCQVPEHWRVEKAYGKSYDNLISKFENIWLFDLEIRGYFIKLVAINDKRFLKRKKKSYLKTEPYHAVCCFNKFMKLYLQ